MDDDIRAALRRKQDDVAFRLLQRAHGPAVYTTCCRFLRDSAAAEDAMQQTLMKAFEHRRELVEVDQIRGWLIRTAINKCRDTLRRRKRRDGLQQPLVDDDAPDEVSLLEQLGTTRDRKALEECLAALDPRVSTAVQMRYHDGMSWAQIAEAVGMPLDRIRMQVHRSAFKRLRDCLAAKGVTP